MLAYNLVTALKLLALPEEYLEARPKRLRFKFFAVAARVTRSARTIVLRLVSRLDAISAWIAARAMRWEPNPL